MNTLSGVYNRKQVLDLICKIAAKEGEGNIELRVKPTFIFVKLLNGKRLLSAIKGQRDAYSVQADISISAALSLPLWRDEQCACVSGE